MSDTFNDIVIGTGIAAEGPPLRREEGRCRHFVLRRPIELRLYVLAVNDSFGRACLNANVFVSLANAHSKIEMRLQEVDHSPPSICESMSKRTRPNAATCDPV